MKKVFSLFITLCLLISSVPTFAEEAEKTIPDTWQKHEGFWVEETDNAIRIMGLAGAADGGTLLVPVEMDSITPVKVEYPYGTFNRYPSLPVQLSTGAFKGEESIETIKFLEGTEVIPAGLCESMKSLKTLQLPKTLKAIDNYAFKNCTALKTIDLSNVQYIGRSAFEGCTSLESITLSANIISIEDYAFKDCASLETVKGLPEGISIGQDAFAGTKVDLNNVSEGAVSDTENYIYPAKDVFKNQSDIVELTSDALSWFPPDNDPESEKYDFTTTDKEIIEAVMKAVNTCRYKEVKGTLVSDGTAFLITVKYSDGTEAYYNFEQSTIYINNAKYQLLDDDYWKLSDCLKYSKQNLLKNELVFSDVAADSEYYKATAMLSSLGIMSGYGDKTFGINKTLTRAEAAAIITRLFNCEDDIKQGATNYTDVPKTHWASGYVNYAEENGIINGRGDDTFAPDEFVTYHQLIKMLVCALRYDLLATANGGWYNGGYITVAEKIGLVEAAPQNPDAPITRGGAALLCYKALDIDFMADEHYRPHYGTTYKILEGETILTNYWGMDYEEVREFYFEKTFGFELPENAECVFGEYFLEIDGDTTCYMGKISFHEKDLDYIKQNLEKQDFAEGTLVEDSDVLQSSKHTRDTHTDWWDAGTFGTQKEHYHWIKEDKTYRYTHAVEFEAYIIKEDTGTYWLYVYRYDNEESNV